jgi:hypothetical protein
MSQAIKAVRDFRAEYNEFTSEEQARLLQLMVQEVVLGKDILKILILPFGDSEKPLEYLLKHPEFAENNIKRPQFHSPQTFVKFAFPAKTTYSTTSGTRWKTIE